jgi:DNA invertase Pin-like site-specific DNA recombinase
MKPCAIYHRVSTIDQHAELARDELHTAAARFGYEVVLELEETGSGAANDRPGLLELLDAARRGRVEAVLVWKLDRFGRSALDLLANIRQLEDTGVRFIAVSQGIDIKPGGDAMGRLLLTMLAAIAEFERDLIRDRTRLGLARARASGKRLGRPPADQPDPALAAQLRAEGLSWRQMSERLGCSVWRARRSLAENGVRISSTRSVEN